MKNESKIMNNRPSSTFLNNSNDIFFFNCENPIGAIASDLECKYLVVGGRDCNQNNLFFFNT